MDGVKQQDSTPQNDSTLGFKWIKKNRTKYCDMAIYLHILTGPYRGCSQK
jgi:hypothetical protein